MTPEDFQAPTIEELAPRFPNYSIDAFIAQGGMGAVYLGTQLSLERPVAIKILPRHLGEDEEFRKSFASEAKAMAKLNHPNLIGVYDFGEVDGMPFIVMEYVPGKSLHHSSHGQQIDPEEASRIVIAVSRGLQHAHENDVLHRDVKPANILLSTGAKPKLGDFGLAMASSEQSPDGQIYGTPGFAAPEVYQGSPDYRSDLYATAVTLYLLLTARMPGEPYQPPSQLAQCDSRYDDFLTKALQPNLANRHQTAEEFADELEAILTEPPVPANAYTEPLETTPKKGGFPLVPTALAATFAVGGFLIWNSFFKEKSPTTQEVILTESPVTSPRPDETTPEPTLSEAVATEPAPAPSTESQSLTSAEILERAKLEIAKEKALREETLQRIKDEAEAKVKAEAMAKAASKKEAEKLAAAPPQETEPASTELTSVDDPDEPTPQAVSTFDHAKFLKPGRDFFRGKASPIFTQHRKGLVKNIDTLERKAKAVLRNVSYLDNDVERARKKNIEREFQAFRTAGVLPDNIVTQMPESISAISYSSAQTKEILHDALEKQKLLKETLEADLQPLLKGYANGIRKKSEALAQEGNQVDADILEREAQAAESSFKRFCLILEGKDLPPPKRKKRASN